MPAATIRNTSPDCGLCYLESARRAAREQASPLTRDIIMRAASARVTREGLAVVSSAHASHTRRMTPWPSDKPAAA